MATRPQSRWVGSPSPRAKHGYHAGRRSTTSEATIAKSAHALRTRGPLVRCFSNAPRSPSTTPSIAALAFACTRSQSQLALPDNGVPGRTVTSVRTLASSFIARQWAERCSLRNRPSSLSPPGWESGTVSSWSSCEVALAAITSADRAWRSKLDTTSQFAPDHSARARPSGVG
jgi:hypothetical protein